MKELKPCPFCGGHLEFVREPTTTKSGKIIWLQYWMHDDCDCLLNDISTPFTLGAGDARPEDDYPGEYAEKWNERIHND